MRIASFTALSSSEIFPSSGYDVALIGEAIDQRGAEASVFAQERSQKIVKYQFDATKREHTLDGKEVKLAAVVSLLEGKARVLLEATTLGVPEIALLMRSLKVIKTHQFDILYIEPKTYKQPAKRRILGNRNFSLTDEQHCLGVPGFTIDFQQHPKGLFVTFLGYEGQRLTAALNQLPLETQWSKVAVFGVPAFGAGWELNSLANNIEQIHQNEFQAIIFCAASSVWHSYNLLEEILAQHQDREAPIVVAPFGTKPHSIATALFLCEHCDFGQTALVFDHPKKSINRSTDMWRWHRYEISEYGLTATVVEDGKI